MCLAQGPQRSDAGEARTRGPSVSSQALYHWATALPIFFFFFFSGRLREVLLYFLPVPNLFLANDILYPCPTSSNSTPESVAPSDINCIAVVDGLERPFATVNLARIDPWVPFSLTSDISFNFHVAWLVSSFL